MISRPLFVSTPVGPLAGIVTLPDDAPSALVMVLQGFGGTRSAVNQMLTRLARSLADDGVATLRADYAGASESFDAGEEERVAGVRALVSAFRDLVPGAPLFLVASCYGVAPAISVLREVEVSGVAVVSPLIVPKDMPMLVHLYSQPVRRALGRLRHRVRYGSQRRRAISQAEEVDTQDALTELAATLPTFVLTGGDDRTTGDLRAFLASLPESSAVELEVVDGCALHASTTFAAQAAMQDGIRRWMARNLDTARP